MIMKVITAKYLDGSTEEFHGLSFTDVCNLGREANLYLTRFDEDKNKIGWVYTSEALIGHTSNNLDSTDYYRAYDAII